MQCGFVSVLSFDLCYIYFFSFSICFQKISEMAHAHGALVLVDNSIMSPVLCQPLELGAGICTWLG